MSESPKRKRDIEDEKNRDLQKARDCVIKEAKKFLVLETGFINRDTGLKIDIQNRFERFAKWYERACEFLEEKQLMNHELFPTPQQLRNDWQELVAQADTAIKVKNFNAKRMLSFLGVPESRSYSPETNSFKGVPADKIGIFETLERALLMYGHLERLSGAATCPVNCHKNEFHALLSASNDKNDLTRLDLEYLEKNTEMSARMFLYSCMNLVREEQEHAQEHERG